MQSNITFFSIGCPWQVASQAQHRQMTGGHVILWAALNDALLHHALLRLTGTVPRRLQAVQDFTQTLGCGRIGLFDGGLNSPCRSAVNGHEGFYMQQMAPPICHTHVLLTLPLLVRDCLFAGRIMLISQLTSISGGYSRSTTIGHGW